jgi:hypothetical protein
MKKVLEVEGDVEKHLVSLMDSALKAGGWAVLQSVDFVRNAIKSVESEVQGCCEPK